jgi:hypothetical protein
LPAAQEERKRQNEKEPNQFDIKAEWIHRGCGKLFGEFASFVAWFVSSVMLN